MDILDSVLTAKECQITETDLVFNPHRAAYVLDELICDGIVCETSKGRVVETVRAMDGV